MKALRVTVTSEPLAPEIRALLVDDHEADLVFADRLTAAGLPTTGLQPTESLSSLIDQIGEQLDAGQVHVVLLDYRLDDTLIGGASPVGYRGGTVAAQLKERAPDHPVVLFTTEQKLSSSLARQPTLRDLFDHQVLKEQLASRNRRDVVDQVRDLALGYVRTAALVGSGASGWTLVAQAMNASEDVTSVLEQLFESEAPAGTSAVARFLLDEVLQRTGPLVSASEAAVRVGLTVSTFGRTDVRELLADASYSGAFSAIYPRWWRAQLGERIAAICGDSPMDTTTERARCVASALDLDGRSIRAAECVWCGEDLPSRACQSCDEPVDTLHSLVVADGFRPRWAEPAVVCFACIQTGRADDVRLESGSSAVVAKLKSGDLNPPPEHD
jgi:hypothetical protein